MKHSIMEGKAQAVFEFQLLVMTVVIIAVIVGIVAIGVKTGIFEEILKLI